MSTRPYKQLDGDALVTLLDHDDAVAADEAKHRSNRHVRRALAAYQARSAVTVAPVTLKLAVTREAQLKVIRKWATEDANAYAAEHAEPGDFVRTKITKRAQYIAAYTQAAEDAGELLPV